MLVIAIVSWLVGTDISGHSVARGQFLPDSTAVWILTNLAMDGGAVAWHGLMERSAIAGLVVFCLSWVVSVLGLGKLLLSCGGAG